MSIEMIGTHKIIFLVEDNKADIRLIQEALKTSSLPHQLVTVTDGIKAMTYLRQEGEYANVRHPDLILLDLKNEHYFIIIFLIKVLKNWINRNKFLLFIENFSFLFLFFFNI